MSRWFRLYDEMLDDPKVQMLSPELFKTWVNLLAVASRSGGTLPTVERLSFSLRVSAHEMQSRLDELVLLALIDIRPDHQLEPHNWSSRQWKSDDSAERVKKFRSKNKCNGDVTVTVTPSESESETDTESKFQLSKPSAAREVKLELGINSNLKSGLDRKGMETLLRQAEGYGLDVADIVEITNRNAKPAKREGYFVTLCINRLKDKLPGLDDQIIRAALNGKFEQHKKVLELLTGALQ